jgi:hypothetical protein
LKKNGTGRKPVFAGEGFILSKPQKLCENESEEKETRVRFELKVKYHITEKDLNDNLNRIMEDVKDII